MVGEKEQCSRETVFFAVHSALGFKNPDGCLCFQSTLVPVLTGTCLPCSRPGLQLIPVLCLSTCLCLAYQLCLSLEMFYVFGQNNCIIVVLQN